MSKFNLKGMFSTFNDRFNELVESTDGHQENLGERLNETTNKMISSLSGVELKGTSRMIDNVVAFVGAAGGTGTSTIVANTAHEMASRGLKVLVIDMNILYPAQQLLFKVEQEKLDKDLFSFITGKNTMGESIQSVGKISLLFCNGRSLMDYIKSDSKDVSSNITNALERLRGLYDVILLDMPLDFHHDLYNTTFYYADTIYLVWNESVSCLANTAKLRQHLESSGVESGKIRVIMNQKSSIKYGKEAFNQMNLRLVDTIPFSMDIRQCGLKGVMFMVHANAADINAVKAFETFKNIVDSILTSGGYLVEKKKARAVKQVHTAKEPELTEGTETTTEGTETATIKGEDS